MNGDTHKDESLFGSSASTVVLPWFCVVRLPFREHRTRDAQCREILAGTVSATPVSKRAAECVEMPNEASPLLFLAPLVTTRQHILNYVGFGLGFGFAAGSLKTSSAFLSSLFSPEIASTGNAFFYGFWMLGAFFCAAPMTRWLGSKRTLVFAQCAVAVYQLLLLTASALGGSDESTTATVLLWSACALAGLAVALLWTAQGVYFANAAQLYATERGDYVAIVGAREAMSWMASVFAALYMGVEVLARCGAATAVLLAGNGQPHCWDSGASPGTVRSCWYPGESVYIFLACMTFLAVLITSFLFDVDSMPAVPKTFHQRLEAKLDALAMSATGAQKAAPLVSPLSTMRLLLTDPRTLLLLPTNLAKGAAETYVMNFVNGDLIKRSMGMAMVGYISGGAVLCAAMVGLCTTLTNRTCGRQLTMQIGHVAWMTLGAVPIIALAVAGSVSTLEEMPLAAYLAIGCYLAYAVGRGVWDSTNRYVSAALFPRNLAEIFALIRFFEGISATTLFLLCGAGSPVSCHDGQPIDTTLVVLGALALPCYYFAESLNEKMQQPAAASADSALKH